MKGQSEFEVVLGMILLLVLAISVAIVLTGGFGYFPELMNESKIEVGEGVKLDDYISHESFHTLGCAVKRVILGDSSLECIKTEYGASVSCSGSGKNMVCTVDNFVLPQAVSDAESFIRDYGDPKFLVYWEKFPEEENTWTFLAGDEAGRLSYEIAAFTIIGRYTDAMAVGKGYMRSVTGILFKRPVVDLVGVGVITASALLDRWYSRMAPQNNTLVMYIPGTELQKIKLPASWEGKPVFLETLNKRFHLASPCYTRSLKVEKMNVKCDRYTYAPDTKLTSCEGPEFGVSEGTPCVPKCEGCPVEIRNESHYRYKDGCVVESIVISDIVMDEIKNTHNYCYYDPGLIKWVFKKIGMPVGPEFTATLGMKIVGNYMRMGKSSTWMKTLIKNKAAGGFLSGAASVMFYCYAMTGDIDCGLVNELIGIDLGSNRWPGKIGKTTYQEHTVTSGAGLFGDVYASSDPKLQAEYEQFLEEQEQPKLVAGTDEWFEEKMLECPTCGIVEDDFGLKYDTLTRERIYD